MNLQSKRLLPVAIVALIAGSATTLSANHHWDDGHGDEAGVAAHGPDDGDGSQASHAHDVSEGISAGDSQPVLPANAGNGDDEEDCGLVIREGDVPVFDNVPCIEPVLLPGRGSLTPIQ